jgi:predicted nucleotidyltransferase
VNENVEKKLWKNVYKVLPSLKSVPFLKMVAVCNNLAFGKVDEESDIDLFIVSEKGRLFMVRFLVTLILQLKGVRRHGKEVAGKFCLSFFVDEEFMNLKKIAIENDIYLSYWIKTIVPVIDDGVYLKFIDENKWTDDFFAEKTSRDDHQKIEINSGYKKIWTWVLNGVFGDFLEFVLRKWQMKRAKIKAEKADGKASLLIQEHILKFHNIDRRSYYRDLWFAKYGVGSKLTKEKFLSL